MKLIKIPDKRKFCQEKMGIRIDNWQARLLETDRNVVIRSGRQVGKSTGVGLKAGFYALENKDKVVLIVAASQRQSGLLFEKVRSFFEDFFPDEIVTTRGMEPTQTRIILKNGTRIYSLPAGRTGYSIRGFSVDLLIADEAAFISEAVWVALVPMLAVTKGKIILLSTPFGKGGFFYNCFGDVDYKAFHLSSEECPRIPAKFLQKEKKRMTKLEYAQEYLGEFVEDFTQLFKNELIMDRCCLAPWSYKKDYKPASYKYYLGVDVARYGGDENAFVVIQLRQKTLRLVKIYTTERVSTIDTIGRIKALDKLFNFSRIFIDDAGVGGGVLDALLEEHPYKRKTIGINNATKAIDKEAKRKIKILKENLYSNLLVLMENGADGLFPRIEMINDHQLRKSLASVQFEYTKEGNLRIYGNYTHIVEATIRGCWCLKQKGLKPFVC